MSLDVAVVVASGGRPALLARCLHALTHQSLDQARYEIVVADEGSDDAAALAVQRFAIAHDGRPAIRYLRCDGERNRGWRASDAPVIAFTDDDTVPERDWLREGLATLTPEVAALAGRVVRPAGPTPTGPGTAAPGLEGERAGFSSTNAFVWRHALQAVGGFDPRFVRSRRDDADLEFSLLEHIGPVAWAPAAVVVHPVGAAPLGPGVRNPAPVYFDALLRKKHPQLYRHMRRHPPWHERGVVGASVAALVALLAGAPWPALVLLAAALGGIAAMAMPRLRGGSHAPGHVLAVVLASAAMPFVAMAWRALGALRFRTLFR